jgi:hypothetical protein
VLAFSYTNRLMNVGVLIALPLMHMGEHVRRRGSAGA